MMELTKEYERKITREEYGNIIHRFFDYFNGRVNLFNRPAKLIIDWEARRDSTILATTSLPNIVVFYPEVAFRIFVYDEAMINETLVTIIHELFHVDQEIDPVRLRVDEYYKKEIEDTIEYEAHMFVAQHLMEIKQVFGIDSFMDYKNFTPLLDAAGYLGHYYHRRNYISHFAHMVEDMVHVSGSKSWLAIKTVMSDPKTNLGVTIDNQCQFMLKIGEEAMPVDQLNEIMYQYYFRYNYRGARVYMTAGSHCGLDWEIHIDTNCTNQLYKVIGDEGDFDALPIRDNL